MQETKEMTEWAQPPKPWQPPHGPQPVIDPSTLSQLILTGDLSKLTPEQKIKHYGQVCALIGVNPTTKPFDYIKLNGKEVLYANKGCAEQLRSVHRVSLRVTKAAVEGDLYVVVVEAKDASGRTDSGLGAVPIGSLKGEALANAMMKSETKAKRRATLSICGLNMLDETEVESIPRVVPAQPEEGDGVPQIGGPYRVDFGKFASKGLEELYCDPKIGPAELKSYIELLESKKWRERYGDRVGPSGETLNDCADRFILECEKFLGQMENVPLMSREPGEDG